MAPTPLKEAATTLMDLNMATMMDKGNKHQEPGVRVKDQEQVEKKEVEEEEEEEEIFLDVVVDHLSGDEDLDPDVANALLTLDVMIAHVNDIDIDALNQEENLEELVRAAGAGDDDRCGSASNGTGGIHTKESANGSGKPTPSINGSATKQNTSGDDTSGSTSRATCCVIQ